MQNLIDDVTRRLVSRLPETKSYYSLTDLHDFQIPNFIITRIELELRKNLADSIVPPATDWANMKSANVNICWDNFIKAIHEQVRLPRSYARSVIEVAVADVLDLLIEPRSNMVEMIFGTSSNLKFEEIRHAASYVTVYSYLPESLIKYMHRKQLQIISKEKAQQIVVLVDEKLTEKYNPLNWAQLIDPLFVLLGEEIESEVFRRFFLDKKKTRWSEFFDKEQNDISRARFIELLTMPEFDGIEKLNENNDGTADYLFRPTYGKPSALVSETITAKAIVESYKEEESTPVEDDISIGKVRDWGLSTNEVELPSSLDSYTSEESDLVEESQPTNELESEINQNNKNESVFEDENSQSEELESEINQEEEPSFDLKTGNETEVAELKSDEENSQAEPLDSEFNQHEKEPSFDLIPEKENDKTELESEVESPIQSHETIFEESERTVRYQTSNKNEQIVSSTVPDNANEKTEIEEIKTLPTTHFFDELKDSGKSEIEMVDDEDDIPIYKRIEAESNSEKKEKSLSEQVKPSEEVPFWKRFVSHTEPEEELVVDLEKQEIDYTDEVLAHLKDMEDEFVRDIFGGETNAYIEAIDELAQFKHWDEASNYIKKEIYRINQIDLYSDSALDFIERLQTYFTTKK